MDPNFVNLLRCPASQQRLQEASHAELEQINSLIACHALSNLQGDILKGALIREDRKIAYPIRNGIPALLIEEGLSLDNYSANRLNRDCRL